MGGGGKAGFSRRGMLRGGVATAAGLLAPAMAPAAVRPPKKWDAETDVLVVGFGIAGACVAHEALKAGLTVTVLDRASAAANESHGTYIYFGGGTALQKAMGVSDSLDDLQKYLLSSNGPDPDRARIAVLVERSLENFDYVMGLGIPFSAEPGKATVKFTGNERAWPCRDLARPAPRGHFLRADAKTGTGAWIQKRLLDEARRLGATLHLAADAQHIVRGDDGVVEGVIALIDGRQQALRARRGVVIATGGFANNREMVLQHAPIYADYLPVDVGANDGWGIRAAQAIGAAVRRMGACDVTWMIPPVGIAVNAAGQRFAPEDAYYGFLGDALARAQDNKAFCVLDANMRGPQDNPHGALFSTEVNTLWGNSIAELEKAMGIPAPALQQAIETYNRYAARGEDPFFHKDRSHLRPLTKGPFSATRPTGPQGGALAFFTLGGLLVTPRSEVLDQQGVAIPHLFSVGRAASGIPSPNYFTSGLSLAECVTFGRLTGQSIAKT